MSQAVPRLAMSISVLRCACLAYAAKVLFLRGELSASVNDYYQGQAISQVIDALASQRFPEYDEALLATAVILRMSEQFCEVNQDVQQHLSGAISLFSLRGAQTKWSPAQVDISGTSFWICIRESLRLCLLNEDCCQFDLSLIADDEVSPEDAEEVWTNRSTLILAKACNFAFGGTAEGHNDPKLAELQGDVDLWVNRVPAPFRPLDGLKGGSTHCPRVYYLSVWHGGFPTSPTLFPISQELEIAWQQLYATKVLLAVFTLRTLNHTNLLELNQFMEVGLCSLLSLL